MLLSDGLFLAAVAAIPIQLNKFFWPPYSFIFGIPIDYRAVAVYFSDLLIIAYILVFFVKNIKSITKIFKKSSAFFYTATIFVAYLLLSSFISKDQFLSMYINLKITEMVLFSLCAIYSLNNQNTKKLFKSVLVF